MRLRLLPALAAAWLCGCGGPDRPPMAPVTGTVTMHGAPVPGAVVQFHREGDAAARPGAGRTDDTGRYRITTFDPGDGGLLGRHRVTVSKALNPMAEVPDDVFPAAVTDPETTTLSAEVTEDGENVFNFTFPM